MVFLSYILIVYFVVDQCIFQKLLGLLLHDILGVLLSKFIPDGYAAVSVEIDLGRWGAKNYSKERVGGDRRDEEFTGNGGGAWGWAIVRWLGRERRCNCRTWRQMYR